jgi:dTDP-4-amino-4,6-dideoxygalactose transaminase
LYVVRVQKDHRAVFDQLRAAGIGVNLHYIPVYRQPYYARMGFDRAQFPEAERYYGEAISIPIFSQLTEAQQGEVVKGLKAAVS